MLEFCECSAYLREMTFVQLALNNDEKTKKIGKKCLKFQRNTKNMQAKLAKWLSFASFDANRRQIPKVKSIR